MSNAGDDVLSSVFRKIEREKVLINAANAMRQQTQNEQVRQGLDTQMREGRRNINYLEERMRELQMRQMGSGVESMNLGSPSNGAPAGRPQSAGLSNGVVPPTPPPKEARGAHVEQSADHGGYGTQDYSQIGGHHDIMPPRHPFAPPGPNSSMPKSRPNYTKLGKDISRIQGKSLN